jgi:hypothetical protein
MKNLYTLILFALMLTASAVAQNPLFRNYGDSYGQVMDHLKSLGYVTITPGEDYIAAETDGFKMFYFFNHKALYKMVMTTGFKRRKDADVLMDHFRSFYQTTQSFVEVNEMRKEKVVTQFTALRSDEQVQVHSHETAGEVFAFQLVAESESWSPDFANSISMK